MVTCFSHVRKGTEYGAHSILLISYLMPHLQATLRGLSSATHGDSTRPLKGRQLASTTVENVIRRSTASTLSSDDNNASPTSSPDSNSAAASSSVPTYSPATTPVPTCGPSMASILYTSGCTMTGSTCTPDVSHACSGIPNWMPEASQLSYSMSWDLNQLGALFQMTGFVATMEPAQ